MKSSVSHENPEKKLTPRNDNVKAFFFLRHNNDIDHMTPVLYKWLSTENVPTDIIITTSPKFLNDYRINILKKFKNANIFYINDLFKKYSLPYFFNLLYFKYDGVFDSLFKKYRFLNGIANRIIGRIANRILKGENKGIVVFDWIAIHFVQQMIKIAKERDFTTISLPHGDAPYSTIMESIDELNFDCLNASHKSLTAFDYVVVPNHFVYRRHEGTMEKERVKQLGSPRYCEEWMNIILKLISPFKTDGDENKLKIVFFLRNLCYPIFWEEVVRTIKLIMQFPNVYLVVKHHPRNNRAKRLTKKLLKLYPELKQNLGLNLEFIYRSINSSSLIKWADLVIDIGTSMTWEPIILGKPVLMPEYLHANYSTVAYYIKQSEIKSRDQLYENMLEFTKNKNRKFYNEEERSKFIKEIIHAPDKYVLERYCKFLKSCIKN